MSYKTVEVEVENGRVWPRGVEPLPLRAHGLLTILEPNGDSPAPVRRAGPAGLHRLLAEPDFPLTPEQFRASMETDPFEQ